MEQVAGHVWESIELSWSQKLAASWSVVWPGFLCSMMIVLTISSNWSLEKLEHQSFWLGIVAAITYLAAQIPFASRLVRKRYRSFRIVAESAEGVDMGRLALRGALPVAVCLLVPQAVFIVATSSVLSLFAYRLDAQTYQSLGSLSLWLRILVVGRTRLALLYRRITRDFACGPMHRGSLHRDGKRRAE
ncbi:MAG TPA: hypothetical protein VKE70_14100 [Candidatus Solibacter sp.]|nr:hypothetical protein [Candidatus Solibacter sp.]